MTRERIEDLGRLAVMLRHLLDHDLMNGDIRFHPGRPKDCIEWFCQKTEDQKDDILTKWCYGFESIRDELYEMLSIAEGTDPLNENRE